MTADPFAALGLPARRDLTDEDVRAAWRRIAAATHPDRDDGGDRARYSAAAAAYDTLRTSFGRGEALADLGTGGGPAGPRRPRRHGTRRARRARFTTGAVLTRRAWPAGAGRAGIFTAAGVAAAAIAIAVAGWSPATIALLVGAATWPLATLLRCP